MLIQLIFVVLVALNLLCLWYIFFSKKCQWYSLIGELVYAVLPLVTVFFAQPRFELDFFWWRIVGGVAIVLGGGILIWSLVSFGKKGLILTVHQQKILKIGPYQFIRHPQYLGLIFIWMGWWWVWSAVYSFYIGMFIVALTWLEAYLEEKLILEKLHEGQYQKYKQHAGMFWIK